MLRLLLYLHPCSSCSPLSYRPKFSKFLSLSPLPLPETEQEQIRKSDLQAVIAAIESIYSLPSEPFLRTRSRDQLSCEARALAAWAILELSSATLTDLATFCQRDVATLSYAAKRAEVLGKKNPSFSAKIQLITQILTTTD